MFLERKGQSSLAPRGERFSARIGGSTRICRISREVDDEVVRSRDNALMLSLEVTGIDGFTSAPQTISALRRQLAQLLRRAR